jgi:hypothetical protein
MYVCTVESHFSPGWVSPFPGMGGGGGGAALGVPGLARSFGSFLEGGGDFWFFGREEGGGEKRRESGSEGDREGEGLEWMDGWIALHCVC